MKIFQNLFRAPTTAETPRTALTQELAVADPRFGLYQSGFYKQITYNPDDLIGKKGIAIYSQMRRDEQVKSALFTKKFATLASGWEVDANGKSRKLDTMKKFIEFNLGEMEGTVETFLRDVLTALDYGFSLTEPCYKDIDYGEFKGQFGFKALKVRRPDQIEFETDQFGNLTDDGILQGQKRLPASRFAIFSYRPEFGNIYGTSDLREAYRPWFLKNSIIKFMAMSLERYGQPLAVASTQTTLSDTEKSTLLQMFRNLQSRTALIVPSTIDVDFKTPSTRVAEAFIPALNKLDQWIAMAILVPSLIGAGGGQQEVGSLARSETEFDTFLFVVEQLRNDLQEFINDRIIKVLLDQNFVVEDGIYPKFKFKELTHERKLEILDLYNKALAAQAVTKTREDEAVYRSLAGLPELPRTVESIGTKEAEEEADKAREKRIRRALFMHKIK